MLLQGWSRPICLTLLGGLVWISQGHFTQAGDADPRAVIDWRTSYADAAVEAASKEMPILIKFTAVWCGACRQMQQSAFGDSRLIDSINSGFVPLEIDADQHSDLVSGFRVEMFPTLLVVSPELKILQRFSGLKSAAALLPELEKHGRSQAADPDRFQPVSAANPVNFSPFAFEGFCLVSIMDDHKLRRGNGDFKTIYRDQEICFHSEAHQKKFLANPEKYWPIANGKCLVTERDNHEEAFGDPRVGVTWRGRLWLFSDRTSQRRFIQSPSRYVNSGM